MKKVLFVNWLPTGSTSLSLKICPHDIDHLTIAQSLQDKGYQVWLQEPFFQVARQSDWQNKIERAEIDEKINQFDMVVLITQSSKWFWDYVSWKLPGERKKKCGRGIDFLRTLEALYNYTGRILINITDPRDEYLEGLTVHHPKAASCDSEVVRKLSSVLSRSEIVSSTPISEVLNISSVSDIVRKDILSRKNILCSYSFNQSQHYSQVPLRDSYQYETVYIGEVDQTKERKNMVQSMIRKHSGSYTAGPIFLKNIPNLTSIERDSKKRLIISKDEVLKLTRNSRVSILVSEPGHINWPTPRMYECLIGGTIPAIHPSFPSASLILRTFKRCAVDHIRDIPYDRSWEEDTYAIAKEEVDNLSKLRPLDIEL
jgi:hypothetical protein